MENKKRQVELTFDENKLVLSFKNACTPVLDSMVLHLIDALIDAESRGEEDITRDTYDMLGSVYVFANWTEEQVSEMYHKRCQDKKRKGGF